MRNSRNKNASRPLFCPVNDPNDWAKEHNQPRYIIDLVKRIVRVSLETMKIVATLPALNERS